MSAEPETIYDDVSVDTKGVTGIKMVDKILGVVLGSVGVAAAAAIAVASIMNPEIGRKMKRITGPGVQKVYAGVNIVWQLLEGFARKHALGLPDAKKSRMEKIFNAVDQGLDLAGIVLTDAGLKALLKKDY